VGKTALAGNWLNSAGYRGTYFKWDDLAVLAEYRRNPLFFKNIVEAPQINLAPARYELY
jgi:hypothetical protein